jgi:DNA-directed RNA polymerase specialized sigma24 family protein
MLSAEAAEQAIAPAFEIANARGADLLVALGKFDAWRGDLASMRGDVGANAAAERETIDLPANDVDDVLVVTRALESLSPRCRETLFLRYVDGLDAQQIASALDMTEKDATRLGENCFRLLMQIAQSPGDTPDPAPDGFLL